MKAVLVVIDGLADQAIPQLDHRSSYTFARHRHMDALAETGFHGYLDVCPAGFLPESMVCILNLLGIRKEFYPSGRAALEILSLGYPLGQDEVVARCNLVVADHRRRLVSFNGGSLNNAEMEEASRLMVRAASPVRFLPLAGYRNLLVLKKDQLTRPDAPTFPPHESLGENVDSLLAALFSSSPVAKNFVELSAESLSRFHGHERQYLFYPWGISQSVELPDFAGIYRCRAAAVCAADIARGIGIALGMDVPELHGLTGDTDTDLLLKARTACSLLRDHEFVFVHINGADEASHRCDYWEKVRFIERIDEEFIAYLVKHTAPGTKLLICADHATDPLTGKHAHLPVPVILSSRQKEKKFLNREILTPADALHCLLTK